VTLRATPFHTRVAEANRSNAWLERNAVTLAAHFGDARDEALAARFSVVLADISWRWRLAIPGADAAEGLARLLTRDARMLSPGTAFKALWLNDKGAVRGAGVLAREADDDGFLFAAAAPDAEWIAMAAQAFGLAVRDLTQAQGGVAIVGPYADAVIRAAGLDETIALLAFHRMAWRGIEIVLSRWGEHGGYEIWCDADDGLVVWDRLVRAGAPFGLRLAGAQAMDILDVEAGVARPGRDYRAARDAFASAPHPRTLGLERLVDEAHLDFAGRSAFLAARASATRRLAGLVIDGETPAPHTEILRDGTIVGRTFSSVYSPALRRAIALAELDLASANSNTALALALPTTPDEPLARTATARVADLPFVPVPVPVGA
jgi:aminomethyltransferase